MSFAMPKIQTLPAVIQQTSANQLKSLKVDLPFKGVYLYGALFYIFTEGTNLTKYVTLIQKVDEPTQVRFGPQTLLGRSLVVYFSTTATQSLGGPFDEVQMQNLPRPVEVKQDYLYFVFQTFNCTAAKFATVILYVSPLRESVQPIGQGGQGSGQGVR